MNFRLALKLDKKKIAVIIGILVIILALVIGVFAFKDKIPFIEKYQQARAEKKAQEIGPLLDLDEMIVNLNGGGILKTEITIEGMDTKSEEHLKNKEVFLRDRAITVLTAKSLEDVRTVEGRLTIKEELIKEMNKISPENIKDVLFRNFIYTL